MAPKPSYQLLIWSIPTVAFLLTCLWYRRKRNSLRSDPGGTASVDLTASSVQRTESGLEQVGEQSDSHSERSQQFKADEKYTSSANIDLKHTEFGSANDSSRNDETDFPIALVQKENRHIQENNIDIQDKSSVQENTFETLQTVSQVKSEPVILTNKELEEYLGESDCKVAEGQESSEETFCKRKSVEDIDHKEISVDNIDHKEISVDNIDHKEKSEKESECNIESNVETKYNAKTEFGEVIGCVVEESIQAALANNVLVLSEKVSEDLSDKSVDILNFQQVQELDSTVKTSSKAGLIPDSFSSSDKCVVTNCVKPECIAKDFESTALQSSLCESCGISDSVLTKPNFEDCDVKTSTTSSVNTSGLVDEPSCSRGAVRTVMARKSSKDLAMERGADSDGTAAHQESKSPAPEQRKSATDNVQVERDSANHSPADVMLGSPAISNYSDANSEGSSDSGKGCSDMATPPPRTPASGSSLAGDVPSIYEFVLPQHLVGRLIGRYGAFVHQIREKTNANILIKRHPDTTKLKICAIEGNQMGIERALEMIRDKFPQKKYPNVTLEQVFFVPATPVFPVPQCVQLRLVEGVNNDVIVSYMVTPAHVFLQQPTHPTFLNLSTQAAFMQACYSEQTVPALPRPVTADVICVAPVVDDWCRAQVVTDESEDGTCTIRLLDYGGYDIIDCSLLRQIRQDFMLLPFQGAEAYLANVSPTGGAEEEWSQEAFDVLEELTKGQVVEAQVVGYAENGVPIIYLYSIVRSKAIFINYELVKRGLADWTDGCTINGNGFAANGDLTEECDRAVSAEQ